MSRELSQSVQTVRLHSPKPNPTRASPYSSGSRCLNRRLLRRECSQGSSAMRCLEEARQRYSGGRRVGPECRASLPRFGQAWVPRLWGTPGVSYTVTPSEHNRVVGDVTWRKWLFTRTGDYPTSSQSGSPYCVTSGYKALPKCLSYAAASGGLPRLPVSGIPAKAQ